MMEIKPCVPPKVPVKNLKWEKIVSLLGEARESLGRYDEWLKKTADFETLKWEESLASLRGHKIEKIIFAHDGLEFAIRWAKKKPLNLQFLCRVHAIVKKDASNPQEIGRVRVKQNWIGPEGGPPEEAYFFPPAPQKIRGYMRELFGYMRKKEKDPLVQLAIFFAQLLIIHPFMDGNGRVARIFIPLWLWKKGLISKPAFFMSSYFERNRLQYFRKLFYVSEKEAWEDWILYFLQGIIEQSFVEKVGHK